MERMGGSAPTYKTVLVCAFFLLLLLISGCGPSVSSAEQIARFQNAGPPMPVIVDRTESYHVVPGDLLEFEMPSVLRVISPDLSDLLHKVEPYLCRVSDSGDITLPVVGQIPVAGKQLSEIEEAVVNAYYPTYVVEPPMVVCRVAEYKNEKERVFTVLGLVRNPKAFPYPPNVQYNVMEAIAFAGGLDPVADPRYVKVYRQDVNGKLISATFGIDERLMGDTLNAIIKPGDVVFVDHTLRTRLNVFLSDVLWIGVGADARIRE